MREVQNSTRALTPGAAGTSTIGATPDGKWVIVTEIAANRIETFAVQPNGRLGEPVVTVSNGGGMGGASCWVIITADDRYAFVANSASDAIASFSVSSNGTPDAAKRDGGIYRDRHDADRHRLKRR